MHTFLKFCSKLPSDIKNRTSRSIEHLLSHNVEDCLSLIGLKTRKLISPLLRKAYRNHVPYDIIKDNACHLADNGKGRIYAVTHRQKEDIIISMIAADDSAYVLFGGLDIALNTFNGLGLWAYGIILVNRDDKKSRNAAYNKMKYVLSHGGNIILFPEGYFNIADDGEMDETHGADSHNSDSWLVQDLNLGAFKLAQETGSEIVPIVLHYDETEGNKCYYHRGRPMKVERQDDILEKKDLLLSSMNTEYYRLIEKYSAYSRNELESSGVSLKKQNTKRVEQLLEVCEVPNIGYKMDMADEKRIGKARNKKHLITPKQAFAHLNHIAPTVKNAFLFKNRI